MTYILILNDYKLTFSLFQRPMMLDAALGLSRLVKEQDDMSWDNVDKVQAYIAKLKQHTDQLAR